MHSMTTVVLCFVAVIHFMIASGNQTKPMEDDLVILNKYLEMNQQIKKFVNSGIKQFLPYFMEANEHLNLSSKCTKNLFAVVSGLRKLKLWALSFIDASGKLSDGILWSNLQMIGNFDQCLNISVPKKGEEVDFRGQHCTVEFKPLRLPKKDPNEPHMDFVEATRNASEIIRFMIKNDQNLDVYTPRFGICIPSGCSQTDVQQVVEYFSKKVYVNSTVAFCQVEGSLPLVTTRTIVIMFIFAFLIAVGIIASGLEYYLKLRAGTEKSADGWTKLLLCFSITSNFHKVMDTTSSQDNRLACLHGIRTLTLFYIIIGHRFVIPLYLSFQWQVASIEEWSKTFFSRVITNSTGIVDVFIFMSGLLNSYLRGEKEKKTAKSGPVQFFLMVLFRIWRLYPAYICAILLNYLFVPRGPLAPLVRGRLWEPCDKYWWRNFLFIQNFFNLDNRCLQHTWYISVEMQLFLFAFIPVTLLLRDQKKGYIINGILVICGVFSSITQAWILKVPTDASQLILNKSNEDYINFQTAHFYPFEHISPYFIGVLLGYFLSRNKKTNIPVVCRIVGWLLASFIYLSTIFVTVNKDPGPYYTRNLLNNIFFLGYKSLSVLAVAWIVFCCANGYGGIVNYILSLKVWVPISRLSYFMYLTHAILQAFYTLNQRIPAHLHEMILIWQYMGDVAITGLLSLALTVLVESPNIALMKMFFERVSKGGKKPSDSTDEEVKKNGVAIVGDGSNLYELKNNFENKISKL